MTTHSVAYTTQIYYSFGGQKYKNGSYRPNQGLNTTVLRVEALGENPFPYLSQLCEPGLTAWLMALVCISKARGTASSSLSQSPSVVTCLLQWFTVPLPPPSYKELL